MIRISLLVLGCFIAMVSCDMTPEMRDELFKVQTDCMKESGATDEMMMNAFAGKFTDAPELAEQLICCAKRGGLMDDDGHLHSDVFKERLMLAFGDEARIDAVIAKCMIERATIQETAVSGAKCLFEDFNS